MTRRLAAVFTILFVAATAAQAPRELFERARMLEESNNKLPDAIGLYAQVASQSTDRQLAATAQMRIGLIHERLGQKAEAQRAFRKVITSFADQPEVARQAQARIEDPAAAGAGTRSMTLRRLWTGADVDVLGSVSKDGRYLSFTNWATGDLGVRDVATGEHRLLTSNNSGPAYTTYAEESTISPDGKHVAYSWYSGGRYDLRVIALNGGAEPRLLHASKDVSWIGPFDWSPDGRSIAVLAAAPGRTANIGLVSVADGSLRVLKTSQWLGVGRLFFSPDGRYLAYDATVRDSQRDVFVLAVDGGREVAAVAHPANDTILGWAPDGRHLLFASNRTGALGLWSVPVAEGKPAGEPELIRTDLGRGTSLGVTQSGALFFGAWLGGVDVLVASVDLETGALLAPPANPASAYVGYNWTPQWSPDGRQLAYISRRSPSPNGMSVVVIQSTETRSVRELQPALNFISYAPPRWAPNGRTLSVQATDTEGHQGIFSIDVENGAVTPLKIAAASEFLNNGGWSSAGDRILFRRSTTDTTAPQAFVERDTTTGAERVIIERRPLGALCLSPDGRWIVTPGRTAGGETALLLIPTGAGEPRELFPIPAADRLTYPAWSPDSRFVVVRRESKAGDGPDADGYWRVPVDGSQPRKMTWALNLSPSNRWISVHPDGKRVAYTSGAQRFEVWVMENFLPAARTPSSARRRSER